MSSKAHLHQVKLDLFRKKEGLRAGVKRVEVTFSRFPDLLQFTFAAPTDPEPLCKMSWLGFERIGNNQRQLLYMCWSTIP